MRKELLPGEQVLVVTRPQPRTLIFPALLFVVVPALAAFACAWTIKGGPARLAPLIVTESRESTPWLMGIWVALAAWILFGYCLPRALAWRATRYTLTNHRLVARYGMLRRRDQQVFLAAVRQVFIHQSLFQRVVRSGNISLETGHAAGMVVPDVPEVARFRGFILDAIGELPRELPGPADPMYNPDAARPWEAGEGGGYGR